MRLYFSSLFILFFLAACSQNKYNIVGETQKLSDGDTLYLHHVSGQKVETLGQTVVKDKKFSFKGIQDSVILCNLVSVKNQTVNHEVEIYLQPGEINVIIGEKRSSVKGTRYNDALQEYKDSMDVIDELYRTFYAKAQRVNASAKLLEEAKKGMKIISLVRSEFLNKFMQRNIDSPVGAYIILRNCNTIEPQTGLQYISQMPRLMKKELGVRHAFDTFTNKIATAEGKKFTDLELYQSNGQKVKLSDYIGKGKIVILNYWSSKSNISKQELSLIKNTIEKFENQSLEVINISLDTNVPQWRNGISEVGENYVHLSDLKGWNGDAVKKYAINSYPYIIIFDKTGTIVRNGLRVPQLQEELTNIINNTNI